MNAHIQSELLFERKDIGSDAWWERVQQLGTPLRRKLRRTLTLKRKLPLSQGVAERDKVELTFLWRQPHRKGGQQAEYQQVYIDVYSHTPHITQQLTSLTRIGETDVWYWRTQVPADWCGSYFLLPVTGADLPPPEPKQERRRWWIDLMERHAQADPFNHLPAHNNGWGLPLAAIQLAPANPVADVITNTPQGRLHTQRWASDRLGNERDIWLYQTATGLASTKPGALPLVILLDGHYWVRHMPLFDELEALTVQDVLPPACYLFIDSLSPGARTQELPCNPDFWLALQQELLPVLAAQFPLTTSPANTLVAGQSFGGLAAVYAVLHWPERFGAALSQSGSFWWPDASETGAAGELTQAVFTGLGAGAPLTIHLDIGCYEQDMLGVNRALRDALNATGQSVTYREVRGGHDWLCWRQELLLGLGRIFQSSIARDCNDLLGDLHHGK